MRLIRRDAKKEKEETGMTKAEGKREKVMWGKVRRRPR